MSNMVVNTNVLALNSHRSLKGVGGMQSTASARLSSGLKINSAADDAAGLAISEKMRSQIRGLDMASKNAQDAISLIQTAEGGMQEIDNMVQRIRELTVYASNDVLEAGSTDAAGEYNGADRQKIQDEIDQLIQEIDDMANRVEFNKKKVINGDYSTTETVDPAWKDNEDYKAALEAFKDAQDALSDLVGGSVDNDPTVQKALQDIKDKYEALYEAKYSAYYTGLNAAAGTLKADKEEAATALNDARTELTNAKGITPPSRAVGAGEIADVAGAVKETIDMIQGVLDDIEGEIKTAESGFSDSLLAAEDYKISSGMVSAINSIADWPNSITIDTTKTVGNVADLLTGDDLTAAQKESLAAILIEELPKMFGVGTATASTGILLSDGATELKLDAIPDGSSGADISGTLDYDDINDLFNDSTTGLFNTTGDDSWKSSVDQLKDTIKLANAEDLAASTAKAYNDAVAAFEGSFKGDKPSADDPKIDLSNINSLDDILEAIGDYSEDPAIEALVKDYNAAVTNALENFDVLAGFTEALDEAKGAYKQAVEDFNQKYDSIVDPLKNEFKEAEKTLAEAERAIELLSKGDYDTARTDLGEMLDAYGSLIQGLEDAVNSNGGSVTLTTVDNLTIDLSSAGLTVGGVAFNSATASVTSILGAIDGTTATDAEKAALVNALKEGLEDLPSKLTKTNFFGADISGINFPEELTRAAMSAEDYITHVQDKFDDLFSDSWDYAFNNIADIFDANDLLEKTDLAGAQAKFDAAKASLDSALATLGEKGAIPKDKDLASIASYQELYDTINKANPDYLIDSDLWDALEKLKSSEEDAGDIAKEYETLVKGLAEATKTLDAAETAAKEPLTTISGGLYFQVGANADQGWKMSIGSVKSDILGIGNGEGKSTINVLENSGVDITSQLDTLDKALTYVTTERSKLGAAQNRLEYTIKSLDISSENLSAAESRIRDTDMAKEMMNVTQANVLQQAATSMLAQANQAPQNVLQLLR